MYPENLWKPQEGHHKELQRICILRRLGYKNCL